MDDGSGLVIYRKWISHETKGDYVEAMSSIEKSGYEIKAVVVDGGSGHDVARLLYPTQMCQFHFMKIILRKLTKNPKHPAPRELLRLAQSIKWMGKEEFTKRFLEWEKEWDDYLKERTVKEETGSWQYTHRRLRSARMTFKMYLPTLFTYQEHPKLHIPKTNNALEGLFSSLKKCLLNHNGMTQSHKERLVDGFFRHREVVQSVLDSGEEKEEK
jgi:hypothetical protein